MSKGSEEKDVMVGGIEEMNTWASAFDVEGGLIPEYPMVLFGRACAMDTRTCQVRIIAPWPG